MRLGSTSRDRSALQSFQLGLQFFHAMALHGGEQIFLGELLGCSTGGRSGLDRATVHLLILRFGRGFDFFRVGGTEIDGECCACFQRIVFLARKSVGILRVHVLHGFVGAKTCGPVVCAR